MHHPSVLRRRHSACAIALALGLLGSSPLLAQSTTGTLFGQVPATAGAIVHVESSSGVARDLPVDAQGRYRSPALPIGDYTVSLRHGDATVDSRQHVQVKVGAASEVSFQAAASTGPVQQLGGVSVRAAAIPPIDVSTTDSRTVIDSSQLRRLPLGRTAEDIARLAPGVVQNSGGFTSDTGKPLVSFGGSSPTENAYYINGFNTTDPLQAFGGITLPYGAIDQQEIYTGGYSAQYGRSDGGVINAVGKRGTNDWHYGMQLIWEPPFARAKAVNNYYGNGQPPTSSAGDLYAYNRGNRVNDRTASIYAGGPLIKDKLFFFGAIEAERRSGDTVNPVDSSSSSAALTYRNQMPRWYGKLDWNITDSNILELTGASDKTETQGSYYYYDYNAKQRTGFSNYADDTKNGGDMGSAKFTSYVTDALTITALYGKMRTHSYDVPANYDGSLTYVSGLTFQNPALNGGSQIGNGQTVGSLNDPERANRTTNMRFDVTYALGSHTISAGIDNLKAQALNQGSITSGPGYNWQYNVTTDPATPLDSALGVGPIAGLPNGAGGYFVQKNTYSGVASVSSRQRAQYVEDKWQVNDRWLLQLGLRNDQFTNYNPDHVPYIRQQKPQWAPRLGFSWDVNGDASFKVYGNAGRYYLGLPLNPALVAATPTLNTTQYFTYSGIAADGTPTGLTSVAPPVSALNQYGQVPDPKQSSSKGIKPEYQDEFILGFTKTAGSSWVYGAKLTRRALRSAIDDFCSMSMVWAKAASLGYEVAQDNGCTLFNPGGANTFNLRDVNTGQYIAVTETNNELGFPHLKRQYYSLEALLEHPFDGKWYGKLDYVFSRSYGNTEGQVRSDISQSGAATSADWDNYTIMTYANGPQNNDHTHQIKLYGYYQITPEWMVSANLSLVSGTPRHCLGYYGPGQTDPLSYGSWYHWCDAQPSPPGKQGRMPWIRQLDTGVSYSPAFADHKLTFTASIFNLLNEQRPLQRYAYSMTAPDLSNPSPNNPQFNTVMIRQQPRYARLSVNYDF
jgi:outer membrane receptor for ferrienterochelin and colicin